MQKILATKTASLTDLRDPMKVIESAGDSPVAIMNRGEVLGYFIPEARVNKATYRYATAEEIAQAMSEIKEKAQPVLEYLKDK